MYLKSWHFLITSKAQTHNVYMISVVAASFDDLMRHQMYVHCVFLKWEIILKFCATKINFVLPSPLM